MTVDIGWLLVLLALTVAGLFMAETALSHPEDDWEEDR